MSKIRQITVWAVLVVIFGLIGWDIYAVTNSSDGTISQVVLAATRRTPSLLIMAGVLVGHLTWPIKQPLQPSDILARRVWLVSLGVVSVGMIVHAWFFPGTLANVLGRTYAPIVVAVGYVLGHVLWPQTPEDTLKQA